VEPIIEVKDLVMSYGNQAVLKGVNFRVYPGQVIGYIGPNGAGKSTTIKIILGLIAKYHGTVKVFGEDIWKQGVFYKGRIGYVPENADVYESLSGHEYISFVGDLYGVPAEILAARATKLVTLLDLSDFYHSRISSYSKGMRQKLLIIASVIHNPDVLFLDEPITGLDVNSVMIFKEIIAGLARQGKTVFYSSHIMEVVEKISDRIILLHKGVVAADGTVEELQRATLDDSLQGIFSTVTGFNNHKGIADHFVAAVVG